MTQSSWAESQRPRASRRRLADLHVLRFVPGESVVHRSWAGTKILSIAVLSVGLLLWPTWDSVALAAVVVIAGFTAARLPRGVLPRPPTWLWVLLGLGALLSLASGTPPHVHLGGLSLGLGGLDAWVRLSLIGIEVLALAALVTWTSPLADLAPALGRLGAPLRRLRLPVDEVVGVVALGIRCLPLLMEEMRVLTAAWRTRRPPELRGVKQKMSSLEELIFVALAAALRRARELAEAIEARGGTVTAVSEPHAAGGADVAVVALVVAVTAAMGLLH